MIECEVEKVTFLRGFFLEALHFIIMIICPYMIYIDGLFFFNKHYDDLTVSV